MGAYFGIACEIVDSGITNVGDLDMAIEVGLVMTPSFQNDEPGRDKEVP